MPEPEKFSEADAKAFAMATPMSFTYVLSVAKTVFNRYNVHIYLDSPTVRCVCYMLKVKRPRKLTAELREVLSRHGCTCESSYCENKFGCYDIRIDIYAPTAMPLT